MLTATQCARVAYIGDGEVYCRDCTIANVAEAEELEVDALREELGELDWIDDDQRLEDAGYSALIRYTVDEEWPGGLWCGRCSAELAEPAEDYCTSHESWRAYNPDGPDHPWCEHIGEGSPHARQEDPCRFPGDDEEGAE